MDGDRLTCFVICIKIPLGLCSGEFGGLIYWLEWMYVLVAEYRKNGVLPSPFTPHILSAILVCLGAFLFNRA